MEFALTPKQEQFARGFEDYLKTHMTAEMVAERDENELAYSESPLCMEFIRQMGRDGWLGVGWPREYGGQGRSPMDQHIFYEIASYHDAPMPMLSLNTVGPAIMRYGSDEQKAEYLPRILSGEMEVCIGYTEPEAGTDLASLKTLAIRDGDEYVINGQKVFTSLAHVSDYIWLAARTDPNAPKKHHGLSVFLVPMNTPGISIEPLHTMAGERNNYTFFDNVRVPRSCLIGEENMGWKYLTTQLDFERIMLSPSAPMRRNIEDTIQWAKETRIDGSYVIEKPWVRAKLAELMMEQEVLRILNFYVAWLVTNNVVPYAEASMIKVFGSELYQRVNSALLQIMGQYGQLHGSSKWAPLKGRVEKAFRSDVVYIFGGGASEVQRNIIAMAGVGMPRPV